MAIILVRLVGILNSDPCQYFLINGIIFSHYVWDTKNIWRDVIGYTHTYGINNGKCFNTPCRHNNQNYYVWGYFKKMVFSHVAFYNNYVNSCNPIPSNNYGVRIYFFVFPTILLIIFHCFKKLRGKS